ncbi:hypothetical protein OLK001_16720 [Synechocystis sp. LKSZ1]
MRPSVVAIGDVQGIIGCSWGGLLIGVIEFSAKSWGRCGDGISKIPSGLNVSWPCPVLIMAQGVKLRDEKKF